MKKPTLPVEIQLALPHSIVNKIQSFVPKPVQPKPPSPGLQRELERLQNQPKQTAMMLKGLDDFILR